MARLEQSSDGKAIELFIDGYFVASWSYIELTDRQRGIICNMIEQAVEHGERKKAAQIRNVLGVRG